ncbi:MAG: hypothetical protein Q4D98_02465 [Planctomycetia bacterium]|nr:hypothetical protein [Planctomycetia bacterium]
MLPIIIYSSAGCGAILLAILCLMMVHCPKWFWCSVLILLCFLICSQSIVHTLLFGTFIILLLGSIFLYACKVTAREHAAWEANQKERCEGYHPNNGWEYIENPDTDH